MYSKCWIVVFVQVSILSVLIHLERIAVFCQPIPLSRGGGRFIKLTNTTKQASGAIFDFACEGIKSHLYNSKVTQSDFIHFSLGPVGSNSPNIAQRHALL